MAPSRALLAVLALNANQPVTAERVALALWGEDAPAGAVKTVQVHVSRLRKALGERDVVVTTAAGYRLRVEPGELDDGNGAAVAEICRRVDGLPLAIELAAARCALLSPLEIAQRLDAAVGALAAGARDAPARQRTLRATIDWSHDLLDADEKACCRENLVQAAAAPSWRDGGRGGGDHRPWARHA